MNSEHVKKSDIAQSEENVLAFWNENNIFQKSLEKKSPKGDFVFYDGPPFATGLPHYGHLLAGTIKDIIPRYKTMQGYRVPRTWGWDCHGLPIENLIEKELGLETKKDIEEYGIEKFNEAARDSVLRYESEWKHYVPRSGRWIDMEHPYMSMQSSYMESVWWIFSELHKKKLTKEDFKAMHLCPRCETTLSNFEVNQGYEDVTDISVTAKFKVVGEENTYFLAWTTTPWTLPGNVALAVGEDIEYIKAEIIESNGEEKIGMSYIFAKTLLDNLFPGAYPEGIEEGSKLKFYTDYLVDSRNIKIRVIDLKNSDLIGTSYEPVFDYYQQQPDLENRANGWKVYAADFVTTEDGTGIVHIAPAFGSDDMELGKKHYLPFIQHVAKNGTFKDDFAFATDGTSMQGMFVKKKGDYMSTDIEIIKRLAHDEKLFSKQKLVHSYPHCWRCDTPLLNYATTSWYVNVPEIKNKLLKSNKKIRWVPEHIGEGRFGKWLEGARDWALSRSRFWGTPLPIWKSSDESELFVASSVDDVLARVQTSGNQYFGLRHGEAVSNTTGVINADLESSNPLTDVGVEQLKRAAQRLPKDIDIIFVSPFERTRQTAEILQTELGLANEQIIVDERLRERNPGSIWEGKMWHDAHAVEESQNIDDFWTHKLADDAESLGEVYIRAMAFMFEIEERYHDKKILIVSHGGVLKSMMFGLAHYGERKHAHSFYTRDDLPRNADLLQFDFRPFPHNHSYVLDLHRPYIDDVQILSKIGEEMKRIEDVFDVWFDSGSMPYAQVHYPFENKSGFSKHRFPAQFIAEGLDQTRGWFYVLSVLGTALFGKIPFENVIVNGLVLAEDGKKMSKRLNNYPDPYYMFNTTGADAVRLYLVSSPVVRGEEFAFSEKGVQEVASKVMGRLRNSVSLYSMYRNDVEHDTIEMSENVLDQWILAKLAEFNKGVREHLDRYELDRAARYIFDFVDDFSTWYVRRSRDRYKGNDSIDKQLALGTTQRVLIDTAKIIAPFVPFVAEEMWQALRDESMPESVHLTDWPRTSKISKDVLETMQRVREIISEGLQLRSESGIKVRQPLASFIAPLSGIGHQYVGLIVDELNVKKVSDGELSLDTNITSDLEREGSMREFLRQVQSLRKKSGLEPHEMVILKIQTSPEGQQLVEQFSEEIKSTASVSDFDFVPNNGDEIVVDELVFTVTLDK